jgi:hypothetical protein
MRYLGSDLHGTSLSPKTTFTVDHATSTSISISDSGAPANMPVTVTATVDFAGDVSFAGGVLTVTDETSGTTLASDPIGPDSPSLVFVTTLDQGPHHLVATYAGIDDLQDPSEDSLDVTATAPDLVDPVVTPPGERIRATEVDGGKPPIRLGWAGSDDRAGVARYQVRRRIGNRPWEVIRSGLTAASLDLVLKPFGRYRFAVRAVDRAGNASPWMAADAFEVEHIPTVDGRITYRGGWQLGEGDGWSNEMVRHSANRGATATFRFTGRDVAFETAVGPNRGRAQIVVDGVVRATVDLYASKRQTGILAWSASWATSGRHTVVVRVLDAGDRVDVDGFFVLR